MKRRYAAIAVFAAALCAGCISLLGPEDLRFRLSLNQNVGLDRKFAVGADGLTIKAACLLAGPHVPAIRGLSWVDVGVYEIRGDARNLIAEVEKAFASWDKVLTSVAAPFTILLLVGEPKAR